MPVPSIFEAFVVSVMLNTGMTTDLPVKQLSCLSEAVYFEAGDQSQRGREAVAHVILNRVRSPEFPDDVCSITKQKGQFSYQSRGKKRFRYNPNDDRMNAKLEASALAATRAAIGSFDPTMGATHFVNPRLATDVAWLSRMRKVAVIGDHAFYKHRKIINVQSETTSNPVRNDQSNLFAGGPVRWPSASTVCLRQTE